MDMDNPEHIRKKERLLIVDDSEDLRKLLSLIVRKAGYEVIESDSGEKALAITCAQKPDLILLDITMPGMDGFEVCRKIKDNSVTKDIPVVFLSAKTEVEDKIRGLETGGSDYITKPFDRGEVLARVENQLKIRRLTMELLLINKELVDKQKRLDTDLKAASGIQQSLLPSRLPDIPNTTISWKFIPSYLIGGDIFNVLLLDEDNIAVYMIDVSGHGVPSALVTVSVSQALQSQTGGITKRKTDTPPFYELVSPREVFQSLDHEYPMNRFEMFFTMIYMIINVKDGTLVYSNAAHPPPVLLHEGAMSETLGVGGTIIGMQAALPFEEEQRQLADGDKIILYTDGITEFENNLGDFYGEERFLKVLENSKYLPVEGIIDAVIASIREFGGDTPFRDDVSIMGIEYRTPH